MEEGWASAGRGKAFLDLPAGQGVELGIAGRDPQRPARLLVALPSRLLWTDWARTDRQDVPEQDQIRSWAVEEWRPSLNFRRRADQGRGL